MTWPTYYETLTAEQRAHLAAAANTSVPYLSQLAHSHRRASIRMARAIEAATNGAVTLRDLRPDLAELFGAA